MPAQFDRQQTIPPELARIAAMAEGPMKQALMLRYRAQRAQSAPPPYTQPPIREVRSDAPNLRPQPNPRPSFGPPTNVGRKDAFPAPRPMPQPENWSPKGPSAPPGGSRSVPDRLNQTPPPGLRNSLPSGPDMSGWADYSKQNYRPGAGNIMQLRNNYLRDQGQTQRGGFSQGGTATYAGGGQPMMAPGQALRNIQMGLRFANAAQMPPSAREAISGTVSALGVPPDDFWALWQQGEPGSVNPNQGMASGFSSGGTAKMKIKKGADGSFEFSDG